MTANDRNQVRAAGQAARSTAVAGVAAEARPRRLGLRVRFVTRMSDELSDAVARAARRDGITSGAWVRRAVMERVGLQSDIDARSNAPSRKPEPDVAALAAAVRELAALSTALSLNDTAGARASVDRARRILIPLAVGRQDGR